MLKLIFYVVVALLVLSFFGISLQHLVQSPTTQSNFSFIGDLLHHGWEQISALISTAWHSTGF